MPAASSTADVPAALRARLAPLAPTVLEITDEVLDSDASLVWRQVFHRRSAMRGVLRWIKEEQ